MFTYRVPENSMEKVHETLAQRCELFVAFRSKFDVIDYGDKKMETKIIAWDSDQIKPMKGLYERLYLNDDWTFHARTSELIHNCSTEKAPNPYKHRKHLACYPAVTHDQQQNKSCSQKFDSKGHLLLWMLGNRQVTPEMTLGKPTRQYSTVWFSKGMRRQ